MERALAISGIAGPVLFWISVAFASTTRPGYDHIRQTISVLGVGASAPIMNAGFAAYGALTVAFAVGLGRELGARGALGASLLGVGGAAVSALAIAPTGTAAHGPLAFIAFLLPALSAIAIAPALPNAPDWARYARFVAALGSIALGVIAFWVVDSSRSPIAGLEERVEAVLLQAWTAALALRLAASGGLRFAT